MADNMEAEGAAVAEAAAAAAAAAAAPVVPDINAAFAQVQGQIFAQQQQLAAIAHQATNHLKPKIPDTFSGTSHLDVETWLFQVLQYFLACHVMDDARRVVFAGQLLRGNAALWWRTLHENNGMAAINSWDSFGEAIKLQFRPVNLLKKARDELNNLSQRDKQSVQDYVTNVRRICLLLPTVTEEEKKERFLFGLSDRRIRTEINLEEAKTQTSMTFETAAQLSERLEASFRSNSGPADRRPSRPNFYGNPRPNQFPRTASNAAPYHGPTPMELGAVQGQRDIPPRPQHMAPAERFNTFQRGANNPPQYRGPAPLELGAVQGPRDMPYRPPRMAPAERERLYQSGACFYCKEPGHLAKDCPKKQLAPHARAHPPHMQQQRGPGNGRSR